jgi:quercetin dioxygenase-like cupin family protein
MSVTPVTHNGLVYAIFVTGESSDDPVTFFTQQGDDFQVGVFNRPAGYEVKPHTHPAYNRELTSTSEFLYITQGVIDVRVFNEDWTLLHEQQVRQGDFLLFLRGGHGLTMRDDTRFIEVKQGPYPGGEAAKSFK